MGKVYKVEITILKMDEENTTQEAPEEVEKTTLEAEDEAKAKEKDSEEDSEE